MEIQKTDVFTEWLKKLKDLKAKSAIVRRLEALQESGHLGDHKYITNAIFELRIHTGPGYRLYATNKNGNTLVILLCGGDKSTQQKDIIKAQKILEELP
ncbi:type II toxin-antitoxin system RelE/ParE family toxin [Helicobacter bizzozeronii]|uniref:type II toxin-antitoxin system RelE/ParE family toxin n=1 Tax=Helicobacter bizzozeronii TaxID=56877 RepID=UPI000CF0A500|nr:type II toxin-antitoxin system RelE/ParE family toxin [Helicobacter bizzozeronii]